MRSHLSLCSSHALQLGMHSELGLWLTEEEVEALVEVLPVDEHANVHYMDFVDSAFDNIQLMYAQKDPHVGCMSIVPG